MQSSLFIQGVGNTASSPRGRSDTRQLQKRIDRLRDRHEQCRTVEEYRYLTTEISTLERSKLDTMERQGQLKLKGETMSIAKDANRETLEKVIQNVIFLIATYESRKMNFPKQAVYWGNRIKELEKVLSPLLE